MGTWNLLFPSHISPPLPHECDYLVACRWDGAWKMPFRSSVSHPGPSWCLGPGNWWGGGGCLLQCVGCGSTSGFSSLDAGSMPTPVVWNNNVCRQYQNPLWGAAGWESLFERICSVPGKRTFCVFHCTHAVYLDSPSVLPWALCPAIIQGSGCLLSIRLCSSSVHQTLILPFASSETHLFSTEAQFKLFKYSSCSPGPSERKPAGIFLTS